MTDYGVTSGASGNYRWAEGHGDGLGALVQAHPELILGKYVGLFDLFGDPADPAWREATAGWSRSGGGLFSPRITSVDRFPARRIGPFCSFCRCFIFAREDALYDIPAPELAALTPPGRAGINLGDPASLRHDPDSSAMWGDVEAYIAQIRVQQRAFWERLRRIAPDTFLADSGRLLCATRDPAAFAAVQTFLWACDAAEPLPVTRVLDARVLAPDREHVDLTTDHRGSPILLSADRPRYRHEPVEIEGEVEMAQQPTDPPYRYRIHHRRAAGPFELDLDPTDDLFDIVQPLPGGRWLLASRYGPRRSPNLAGLYDPDGRRVGSLNVGQGVKHLHVTEAGHIWIGYGDEGVYSLDPQSHAGLVCLDSDGRPIFDYLSLAKRHGLPVIDDCYAVNVASDDETWTYYYAAFALVRLNGLELGRIWRDLPIQGMRGFAVDGHRALMAGRSRYPAHLWSVDLETMAVTKLQPVVGTGERLAFRGVFGRGARLYLQRGSELFLASIDQPRHS